MKFIKKLALLGFLFALFLTNIQPIGNSNESFKDLIIKSESLYLDEEGKKTPLEEKQEVLKELYSYKDLFRRYLKDEDFIKNHSLTTEEKEKIEDIFFPLIKEVIRRLENQIESEYKPLGPSHFQRIGRPLVYSVLLAATTYVIAELLEKKGVVSKDTVKKVGWGAAAGGTTLATALTLFNYKDLIEKNA